MYTIGELSRITGLAVTALHYYDRIGILVPEMRNPATNYRYYSEKQLLQVQLINNLKMFGLPLSEIQEILQEESISFLRQKLENVMDHLEHQMEAIKSINNYLYVGEELLFSLEKSQVGKREIELRVLATSPVISVRKTFNCRNLSSFLQECSEIQKIRSHLHLFQTGALLAIIHNGYVPYSESSSSCDMEFCMPVDTISKGQHPNLKMFPQVKTLSLVSMGTDSLASAAYRELLLFAEKENYIIAGNPILEYLLEPCDILYENNCIIRLHLPVFTEEK